MLRSQHLIAAISFLAILNFSEPAMTDECIRSCTSHLYVYLTYQPEGQANVERKTSLLKTTKSLKRDGRAGDNCLPHNILKAKERACTEAVRDLVHMQSSSTQQKDAVCAAVQNSETLIPRPNVQDEIFPKADWYSIDHMEAKAERDAVRLRAEVSNVDHHRFRCENGRALAFQSAGAAPPPPPTEPGPRTQPPPPTNSGYPAPPPTGSNQQAPPPPPTLVDNRKPDLFISEFSLTPAVPVQGQPVEVRIGVYNRGPMESGPFTVKWWPGEKYPDPACNWEIDKLAARGGRILTCSYDGYPSWYAVIMTKVVADTDNIVDESVENNNTRTLAIKVNKL